MNKRLKCLALRDYSVFFVTLLDISYKIKNKII